MGTARKNKIVAFVALIAAIILILLTISMLLMARTLHDIIENEALNISRELGEARLLLHFEDTNTETVARLTCCYKSVWQSLNRLDGLYRSFYPKAHREVREHNSALLRVYSDLSEHLAVLPLDLEITDDGKTVQMLAADVTKSSYDIWSAHCNPQGHASDMSLKKIGAACNEIHAELEASLSAYCGEFWLNKNTSIFAYYDATDQYCNWEELLY